MGVQLKVGTQSDAHDCGTPCKCSVEGGFEQRGVKLYWDGRDEQDSLRV